MKRLSKLSPDKVDLDFIERVIQQYLKVKPFFYGFIRPQEAWFFKSHSQFIRGPVLDFGCDDGFFASLCIKTPIAYGLDLPGTGIEGEHARKIYSKRLVYDGGVIPLPDKSVQTVVSNCVFEHITNMEFSLQEMNRILKPGGYLLASMMTDKWEKYVRGKNLFGISYLRFLRKQQVHINLFSVKKWRMLYQGLGFVITEEHGYLSRTVTYKLELAHFQAIPQLITKKITGIWKAPFIRISKQHVSEMHDYVIKDLGTKPEKGAAVFIVAQKV